MEVIERVRVSADPSILRREVALLVGAPSVCVALAWALSEGEDVEVSLPWMAGIWVVLAVLWGSLGALPFWIRYHRVALEVTPERLIVRSGKRTTLDLKRDEIIQVRVYGRATWSSLLWPHNHVPGPFPVLTVWSSNRWECPLMLWGKAAIDLERNLNRLLDLPRYHR